MYLYDLDNKTKDMINECIDICKAVNIPISKSIIFGNSRGERTHGYCKLKTDPRTHGVVYLVNISSYLVNDEEKKNTIIHELLHTCDGCFNHGTLWQHYGNIIKRNYGIEITRCSKKEHTKISIASSHRKYFTAEEYKEDGGKYLVALGRVGEDKPIWFVKKNSTMVKNLSNYTSRGKALKLM